MKNHYKYVDHDYSSEFAAIKLTKGPFKGIVYHYGKVQFNEHDTKDQADVNFHYNIIENPTKHTESALEKNQKFIRTLGDVLIHILDQQFSEHSRTTEKHRT